MVRAAAVAFLMLAGCSGSPLSEAADVADAADANAESALAKAAELEATVGDLETKLEALEAKVERQETYDRAVGDAVVADLKGTNERIDAVETKQAEIIDVVNRNAGLLR